MHFIRKFFVVTPVVLACSMATAMFRDGNNIVTIYDNPINEEIAAALRFSQNPADIPNLPYRETDGAVRDTIINIQDIAIQALQQQALRVGNQMATTWNVNHGSVWRDSIAAGLPVSSFVVAQYFPATAVRSDVWGRDGASALAFALMFGFQPIRFYTQEFGQLALRNRYGVEEQRARWISFGVSFALGQFYAGFVVPSIMNKLYEKKDADEIRRRQLLYINICDPDYARTRLEQAATPDEFEEWYYRYNDCLTLMQSRNTSYNELARLFASSHNGSANDPAPQQQIDADKHPHPGLPNLAKYIHNNINYSRATSGPTTYHYVSLPAKYINGQSLPSFSAEIREYSTTMNAIFRVNGKAPVSISYTKAQAQKKFPDAPTSWPPYIQP